MILLIEYFKSTNLERDSEYLFCINQNVSNPSINEICVFISDDSTLNIKNKKIKIIKRTNRPTFFDLFDYANKFYPNKICAISNTDIFFDHTISEVKKFDFDKKFLALTRWDIFRKENNWYIKFYDNPWWDCYLSDGSLDKEQSISTSDLSQDAWIFKTPVPLDDRSDFLMGKPGCDNRITQIFHENEYDVRNPSKKIKILHYHQTNYRTYTNSDVIPGPYLLVKPTDELNMKSKIKTIPHF